MSSSRPTSVALPILPMQQTVVVQQIVEIVEIRMVEEMVVTGNAATRQNIVGRTEHAPTTVVLAITKGRDTTMKQLLQKNGWKYPFLQPSGMIGHWKVV